MHVEVCESPFIPLHNLADFFGIWEEQVDATIRFVRENDTLPVVVDVECCSAILMHSRANAVRTREDVAYSIFSKFDEQGAPVSLALSEVSQTLCLRGMVSIGNEF